uniref:methionyl-tRNA formyltransferase n=1 Tax=Streptococcus danieliae TaxID=747656 RepID=UPI0026F2D72F
YQPEKLSGSAELEELMTLDADGIVTAAFGQFLPTKLLNAFDFSVNVHASLLPKYRGGAPIHYALINGDEKAGVTLMEMVKEMDAGDMIAQDSLPIEESDTVGSLFEKLAILGRDLLLAQLEPYVQGALKPIPQDPAEVTFSPNIQPEEERLDWNKTAVQLFNQVRGMNPWPVAHTYWQDQRLKVHAVKVVDSQGPAGAIIYRDKKALHVAAGEGAIALEVVQPFGKGKMTVQDFLNGLGRDVKVGDRFE